MHKVGTLDNGVGSQAKDVQVRIGGWMVTIGNMYVCLKKIRMYIVFYRSVSMFLFFVLNA